MSKGTGDVPRRRSGQTSTSLITTSEVAFSCLSCLTPSYNSDDAGPGGSSRSHDVDDAPGGDMHTTSPQHKGRRRPWLCPSHDVFHGVDLCSRSRSTQGVVNPRCYSYTMFIYGSSRFPPYVINSFCYSDQLCVDVCTPFSLL